MTTKADRRKAMKQAQKQEFQCEAHKGTRESHLKLPAGIEMFKVEKPQSRVFDIIGYLNSVENKTSSPVVEVVNDPEPEMDLNLNFKYFRPYITHTFNRKKYACPRAIGLPCPMCEQYERDRNKWGGDKETYTKNKDKINVFKPTHRVLYNILEKGKVFVWDASADHVENLIRKEVNEDYEQHSNFKYLDEGLSLKMRFTATDFSDKYFRPDRIDFLERDDIDPEVLNRIADLNTIIDFKSYDELLKAMNDGAEEKAEEIEEEEAYTPEVVKETVQEEIVEEKEEIGEGW